MWFNLENTDVLTIQGGGVSVSWVVGVVGVVAGVVDGVVAAVAIIVNQGCNLLDISCNQ